MDFFDLIIKLVNIFHWGIAKKKKKKESDYHRHESWPYHRQKLSLLDELRRREPHQHI